MSGAGDPIVNRRRGLMSPLSLTACLVTGAARCLIAVVWLQGSPEMPYQDGQRLVSEAKVPGSDHLASRFLAGRQAKCASTPRHWSALDRLARLA